MSTAVLIYWIMVRSRRLHGEENHSVAVQSTGFGDLVSCSSGLLEHWEDREGRADERCSRGNAFVGGDAADKSKVFLVASTKGGSNGLLAVCFDFFCEVRESRVGRITDDFRQRGMLEVGFPIVYLGAGHCLVVGNFLVVLD